MREEEARDWLCQRVPRETFERCEHFVAIVLEESAHQNLISPASKADIWTRHIIDSAQLLDHAVPLGRWIDLGAGAGFPGVVVALISDHRVALAESRTKRVAYLERVVATLDLSATVSVRGGRIETMPAERFDIISARAYAPLGRLFASALHLSGPATRWILPKGRGARAELEAARRTWQGDFAVVPSITDPEAAIIVAENVRPRGRSKDGSRR